MLAAAKTLEVICQGYLDTGLIDWVSGELSVMIRGVASPEKAEASDLVFIWNQAGLDAMMAKGVRPGALVVHKSLYTPDSFAAFQGDCTVLLAQNPELAMAYLSEAFVVREKHAAGLSETAVVHPTAKVAESASIGDYAVIAADVKVGEGTRIGSHVSLEPGVTVGRDCLVEDRCFLGRETHVGDRVHIKPGAVLGSEGFGWAMDGAKFVRLPHLGRVVIEDDVAIGANATIDRAKIDETRIGRGTKIDNLCHIAHNVRVGEDCALTAQCGIAGTTVLGSRVHAGGQTGIYPQIKVTDDVGFGFRAAVTQDISKPGAYAGVPAAPLADFLRRAMSLKKLPEMVKQMRGMQKRLSRLEELLGPKEAQS